MVAVSDNGCGMSAQTKSQIFEPFFTTKEPGKGTGLGLAIVFGIVKQSGGQVFVHSELGKGTSFKICFPSVEAAIQPDGDGVLETPACGTETILLVEDEVSVRESTAEYLAENGYTVLKAKTGPEALQMAEQHGQPIDLLLTDLVMPQMSGSELSERIVRIYPNVRVVFMSGYSNNLLTSQQILDSQYRLLQKPFRLTTLGRCLREVLSCTKSAAAGK